MPFTSYSKIPRKINNTPSVHETCYPLFKKPESAKSVSSQKSGKTYPDNTITNSIPCRGNIRIFVTKTITVLSIVVLSRELRIANAQTLLSPHIHLVLPQNNQKEKKDIILNTFHLPSSVSRLRVSDIMPGLKQNSSPGFFDQKIPVK